MSRAPVLEHEPPVAQAFRWQGESYFVALHASRRYTERVRPGKVGKDATDDLIALIRQIGTIGAAPPWLGELRSYDAEIVERAQERSYVYLGDDIAMPLERAADGWHIFTVLTRGAVSPEWRAKRKRRRRHHVPKAVRVGDRLGAGRKNPRKRGWSRDE